LPHASDSPREDGTHFSYELPRFVAGNIDRARDLSCRALRTSPLVHRTEKAVASDILKVADLSKQLPDKRKVRQSSFAFFSCTS
jgi:hypothetical protein